MLKKGSEQMILNVAPEHNPNLNLALLRLNTFLKLILFHGILDNLCDDEEVPHLNLVFKELPSAGVLYPDPVLEDAHVLLRVAVNGKVHKAHLDPKKLLSLRFDVNSRPGYQMDRREGQTRMRILGSTLAQG